MNSVLSPGGEPTDYPPRARSRNVRVVCIGLLLALVVPSLYAQAASYSSSCATANPGVGLYALDVELPLRCEVLSTRQSDGYEFYLESGETLWARLALETSPIGKLCYVPPTEPDWSRGPCHATGGWTQEIQITANASGYWQVLARDVTDHTLAISKNVTGGSRQLVGGTYGQLNRDGGPSSLPLDGYWLSLPVTGTGHETLLVKNTRPLEGQWRAEFYRDDLTMLPSLDCQEMGADQECAVAEDAAWAYLFDGGGPWVGQEFRYEVRH